MERRQRIKREILLLVLSFITLSISIAYTTQLWKSYGEILDQSAPGRSTIYPMYSIVPAAAMATAVVNCYMYTILTNERKLLTTMMGLHSALACGWIVTVVVWGGCASAGEREFDDAWPKVCVQAHLSEYQSSLRYPFVVMGALTLFCYLIHLYITILDFTKCGRGNQVSRDEASSKISEDSA